MIFFEFFGHLVKILIWICYSILLKKFISNKFVYRSNSNDCRCKLMMMESFHLSRSQKNNKN